MSVTMNVSKNNLLGGIPFTESRQITADAQGVHSVNAAAAEVGELTTRTGNTEGTITMDESDHGVSTGNRIDLYWNTGSRRGVTAGTVVGAAVPFSGGAGDNLPAATTEIFVAKPTELAVCVEGDNVKGILFHSVQRGTVVFVDDAPAEAFALSIGAGVSFVWHSLDGTENPLDGDIIEKVFVSQATATAAAMKVGILYDN